jgi:hypothetical protein
VIAVLAYPVVVATLGQRLLADCAAAASRRGAGVVRGCATD